MITRGYLEKGKLYNPSNSKVGNQNLTIGPRLQEREFRVKS